MELETQESTSAKSGLDPQLIVKKPISKLVTTRKIAKFVPLVVLLVVIATFSALSPNFFTSNNLLDILRQVSITGFLAIGATFVILIAGIDLSVGSLLGLTGIVAASINVATSSVLLSIAVPLLVGLLTGIFMGWLNAKWRVPSFVVTLGGLEAFRGVTLIYSHGSPISGLKDSFTWIGQGMMGPIPVPVILFLLLIVISHLVLNRTTFGRHIYAVGGNPQAARLSGINVQRLTVFIFGLSGLFSALGGIVLSARLASGDPNMGVGYELQAIAAVVIGGTSLFGGVGGVIGTLIGSVLIGVINNGLLLLDVNPYVQPVVIGIIVVLAVLIDQLTKTQRD